MHRREVLAWKLQEGNEGVGFDSLLVQSAPLGIDVNMSRKVKAGDSNPHAKRNLHDSNFTRKRRQAATFELSDFRA